MERVLRRVADVAGEIQDMAGVSRAGWATDTEGDRIDRWQPAVEEVP